MNQTIYAFNQFQIDKQKRLLLRDGQPVQLTSKAFDLLLALIESGGREITKDELMETVWANQIVEDANLTVTMSHVRKALGERANEHRFIVTIPGRGYRFVGEMREPDGFIIEEHIVSQIIIEHESENGNEPHDLSLTETKMLPQTTAIANRQTASQSKSETAKRSRLNYILTASVFLVCVVVAFGVYKFLNRKKTNEPFQKIKLTRLTNNGKVAGAAISPDAKFIAYVLSESEGNSIWVQQVGTASNIRIIEPTKSEVWGLTFSPGSTHIYYNLFSADKTDPELFKVPSLGGVVEKIPNIVAGFITFAPDGKRFAYPLSDSAAGFNYLIVADAGGSNKLVIAKKKQPNTFGDAGRVASWSPDGKTIACLVNHFETDASYSSIIGINVKDGTEKPLSTQRWHNVHSIEWLKDGSGLLISASDKVTGGGQVWFLPYPEGEARRITNDLNTYHWLSVTANGESLATVQTNTVNRIFVGEAKVQTNDFKEIVSEVGMLSPFVWTPDGKIIFRSDKDGISNLWIMDADGNNRKQLTTNAQVDTRGLCISPDGKHLVFASWRSGKSNLWRVDTDGGNLAQLTDGAADAYPQCTPDGQWVVYQRGLLTFPTLWKVPLSGGTPERLTEFLAKWPAISNDGNHVSYFYMADDRWNIGIISSGGGAMLTQFVVPATLRESVVRWSPDNQSLFYISTVGNVGNIRSLSLDGKESKPVTNFNSHSLEDFAYSPDKKLLAVTRSATLSDVILIERVKEP